MTELAARLDPCVNWFKLLARTKGRVLWLFPAMLFGAYLGALSRSHPLDDFFERRARLDANAPLLDEARGLNLDYEQVLGKPQDYVGKPVAWCVDTPNASMAYVAGRPSWPVALDGAYEYSSVGHCRKMLTVITGFEHGLIQLRLVERL